VFQSHYRYVSSLSTSRLCNLILLLPAGIARKQSQYRAQFVIADNYERFHNWLARAAKFPFPQTADTLQGHIVSYLEGMSEHKAAQWFSEYMTGEDEGKWMLAHSSVGTSANNMGNKSYFKWTKAACNSKKNVSLNHFLGHFMAYNSDCAQVEFSKVCPMLPSPPKNLSAGALRPYAYPSSPAVTIQTWERVQRMEWDCIGMIAMADVSKADEERFYTAIDTARQNFIDTRLTIRFVMHGSVLVGDAWSYLDSSFRATTMLRQVVMPTQNYLVATRSKNEERWQAQINARAQLFVRVCIFGTEEVGMKEMIRLSEEFVFCEALEAKWSNQIRHKCSCPDFFRSAQCEHVVVLAMLADQSTSMEPVNADLKKVRQRAGKKRGRPAGDGDSDSLDEKRSRPKKKPAKEAQLLSGLLSDSGVSESDKEVQYRSLCDVLVYDSVVCRRKGKQ